MKKFNKAPKKLHQVALENAETNNIEIPQQQSLLEKELVKQISNKPLTNTSKAKTTTTETNSHQSSVIVNYENNRKCSQQSPSSQFVQKSAPLLVDMIDAEECRAAKDGMNMGKDANVKFEEHYDNAKYYNGQSDDNRVEQKSNSPIMLTTMQPVPIDHPIPMTPIPNEQSLQQSPPQMQGDFLQDNGEQVQQFVNKTNGEMIIQGHPEDAHIYQNIQQSFNDNSQHLVNDISSSNTNIMRQASQVREDSQIIRNPESFSSVTTLSSENSLSQESSKNILAKRLIGGNAEYLNENNVLSGNPLQDQQLDDPSQPQKTVIYLQSTTNENGQQTFIYDPAMQTQHIPTEIVGGLLQSSGLISGGNGLVNLQDGTGGTTVLVLQEMPAANDMGVVSSADGNASGVVGDLMASDASLTATGGMTTLSNVAASATKIPTLVGFRKRKDLRGGDSAGGRMSDLAAEAGGNSGGLSTGPGGSSTSTSAAEDPGWRAYYEHQHPLSAATSAMLNINGSGDGEHGPGSAGSNPAGGNSMPPLIYEYYKIPQLGPGGQSDKDVWPSTSLNQTVLTSGGSLVGTSSSLLTTSTKLGGATAQAQLLDPNSLHNQSNLQDLSLFLHQQNLLGAPGIVKREPEDLSHRRASPSMTDLKKSKIVLVSGGTHAQNQDSLVIDVVNNNNTIKDEFSPHNRNGGTTPSSICSDHTMNAPTPQQHHMELINTDNIKHTSLYSTMTSSGGSPPMSQYNIEYASPASGSQFTTNASSQLRNLSTADTQYYREYFNSTPSSDYSTNQVRTGAYGDMESSLMERYVRSQQGPAAAYHTKSVISASGLTVDLPSPDSGIGADTITPRDPTAIHQSFDYSDMCSPANLMGGADNRVGVASSPGSAASASNRSRPWHDFGRQNDADKIQIPKLFSSYGFKYTLETPISTNQRREDDRVTYINKGQFYGITMEYIPDPDKPLKSQTVKSIVMLMFREEKSPEDEIKAWQFWHSRQHSVKQRILDADTKNSVGLVGCIEEISHNAIAVYWNPLESPAKINIAVQCLSTDFSSQKGVKGLPLHVQIDTYDDPRDGPVLHRGYVQLKVFCDKGAERKTRDEERRAAKRKMTATGRKKMDELYHAPCERSEFYTMADTNKPPVLFSPAEDIDKIASMELGFYGHEDTSSLSNGEGGGSMKHGGGGGGSSPFLIHSKPPGTPTPPTLKFHNHFPPDTHTEKKDLVEQVSMTTDGTVFSSLPLKRPKLMPPLNERVMLYVRQESDEIYTPLHVSPPSTQGLLNALELKYNINASNICNLLRKNLKGIIVKMDDEMLKYYCNEDLFLLEVEPATDKPESDLINIILCEIDS